MTQGRSARFPRREFLVALAGLGSLGAGAWVIVPTLPGLMREASVALPAWATTTPMSASAYRTAVLQPDLLASLPCFCGCASFQPPHLNLRDCFIRPDGGFEAHAAGCKTCQDEALVARKLAGQGVAIADIREALVRTFGEIDEFARNGESIRRSDGPPVSGHPEG